MSPSALDRLFLRLATITLIFLYLVILAGSVVRATGSGMGCPDWPKCFGYYIPPTDPSQVEFHPAHSYEKGMMIIVNDTLWRATSDFTSAETFNRANWEKYPVHDYAKFYVQQTWTEYVNRLVGALSSFSMTVLLVVALLRVRRDWPTVVILLFGMGVLAFVVWLGKVVVDTNLAGASITLHMMSALALVSVVIYTRTRVQFTSGAVTSETRPHEVSFAAKLLLVSALLLTLIQIVFGTQVRQQIDEINHNMDGHSRETWIGQISGAIYPVHQITAMLIVLLNAGLFFLLRKTRPAGGTKWLMWSLLAILLAEYFAGVFIHNFSIPAFAQPVHLLLAMVLFGVQFALLVRTRIAR
jgi:heme a synthase